MPREPRLEGLPDLKSPDHGCRLYEGVEYADYWASDGREDTDELEKAVVGDLLPETGRRLVDIGCGFGRLAPTYEHRFQEVIMLDGSLSLLRQARERTGGRHHYIAADVLQTPLRDSSVDAALLVRVYHHLSDGSTCLAEMRRILCGGGVLVLNYGNKRTFQRVLRWVGRSRRVEYHPLNREPMTVWQGSPFRYHHPDTLRSSAMRAGLDPIGGASAGLPDFWPRLARNLRPEGRLAMTMMRLLGRLRATVWVFDAYRASGTEPLLQRRSIGEILVCPACRRPVKELAHGYECASCHRFYPVVDGILDFRLAGQAEQ